MVVRCVRLASTDASLFPLQSIRTTHVQRDSRSCRDRVGTTSTGKSGRSPDSDQGMCRPEMLRATTNRWISDVPSKIV